ncbi:interleukin-17D-like [Hemiscyllium ocellatum]|uniref:interleukin-17D-like n=1 Tax=Hemiscyllium ocellatum TaxID=170820 RepID=UPI0029675B40|nr:interleukin-17D-like [Hemiscyllium ocellatum]
MYFKVEWVVCLVLLSKVHPSSGAKKLCAEPSNKELSWKLNNQVPLSGMSSARHLEPGKAFNTYHQHTAQIGERSTSPWSYRINEDQARYPRKLMEAYCLHKGCLGPDGLIDNTVMSVPYHTSVLVLRRTRRCKHKTYIYKLVQEKIPVFCVCVMHDVDTI